MGPSNQRTATSEVLRERSLHSLPRDHSSSVDAGILTHRFNECVLIFFTEMQTRNADTGPAHHRAAIHAAVRIPHADPPSVPRAVRELASIEDSVGGTVHGRMQKGDDGRGGMPLRCWMVSQRDRSKVHRTLRQRRQQQSR